MAVKTILLLGNPTLFAECRPYEKNELEEIREVAADLHDTMMDFRHRHNAGRAIAAPQIGVTRRLVYMHIDKPVVFINPVLDLMSSEMVELWDDCMSFPDLLVKVRRHRKCRISYVDDEWKPQQMLLADDMSELLQHEVDHLDGILAVQRAIDGRSFRLRGATG